MDELENTKTLENIEQLSPETIKEMTGEEVNETFTQPENLTE